MILVMLAVLAFGIPMALGIAAANVDLWIKFAFPVSIILFFVVSIWMYKNKGKRDITHGQIFAMPDALVAPTLQNMNIRISDLTREEFTIRNKVFDNCHIYGPAIIALTNSTITKSIFEEVVPSGALIETSNKIISGAILLENCIVRNCTLHKIGIIGAPEAIKKIKEGFIAK
jgi:hypothetical protein